MGVTSNASWDRSHGGRVPPGKGQVGYPQDIRPGGPLLVKSGGDH